jgi:thymidylate synthase (FAD)
MTTTLVSKTIGVGEYGSLTPESIIAAVARHGTIKEDNGKLVKYLMEHKHYSPLQHVFFSFKVETSRAISAQIFRHRSLHFQETSQRYEEIQEFEFPELRAQAVTNRQSSTEVFNPQLKGNLIGGSETAEERVQWILAQSEKAYKLLLKAGVARECARMILPMCSKTTIHITGTLRDFLAFLNVRCDHHAQKEVQDIATRMGELIEEELPNVMGKIDWRNGMFM